VLREQAVGEPEDLSDEVRALRDDIAKEHGYDINAIFEALREAEKSSTADRMTLARRRTAERRAAADRAASGR
jgi:hypothetical protein